MQKERIPAFTVLASLIINATRAQASVKSNAYWWPQQLDLSALRLQNPLNNPMGDDFDYAKAFSQLDLNAVKKDLTDLMTTSQSWWPADFGHYGPFFIRMTWHAAGTYRVTDGCGGINGGMQRFAPLNSWPDNVNLDKARRLLWPIKQKYGRKLSWADLMALAGTVAMESMGFKTLGFAGGREDAWVPDKTNWGTEDKWLASKRCNKEGQLDKPYGATEMGLIYVNPEGPNGNPNPLASAKHIRATFARMSMNDEETVALIAGGHAFGKAHGAANASKCLGPAPEAASIQEQGMGWKNSYCTGKGSDTISSGLEGSWTATPTKWTHDYLKNLLTIHWVKTKSPAGAHQWEPQDKHLSTMVPDAHDASKRHPPMMFTTDIALKEDLAYRKIIERFSQNPQAFDEAFAKAWFKLTHRDMGPRSRYLGSMVPKEVLIWQDPLPEVDYAVVNTDDIEHLKTTILNSGLTVPQLVRTAWASASVFRSTDKRGGANGARIRLEPQKNWPVNDPKELAKVLNTYEYIQQQFNTAQTGGKKVSMADLIVLGGSAAIEKAAQDAGFKVTVPFIPGRVDALQTQTDVNAFAMLKPTADGFRNYFEKDNLISPPQMLVDKASQLNLTVSEMTVLVGGMRALNANAGQSSDGVMTTHPASLTNAYFVNLLDMSTQWKKSTTVDGVYEGYDRKTDALRWKASSIDLIFGSNSELRAVAEVYAMDDAKEKFVHDFIRAWVKVMNADRFDLQKS